MHPDFVLRTVTEYLFRTYRRFKRLSSVVVRVLYKVSSPAATNSQSPSSVT